MWEFFCDTSYYDKWAVRNADDKSFNSAIHVGTKEEADFLVESLNGLAELQAKLGKIASMAGHPDAAEACRLIIKECE